MWKDMDRLQGATRGYAQILQLVGKTLCVNSSWKSSTGAVPRSLNHSAFLSHFSTTS